MHIPVTETIWLELIAPQHSVGLYAIAEKNRETLRPWLPWVDRMADVRFIEQYIQGALMRHKEGQEYAFVIEEAGKIIGRIGVYKIDPFNKIGEIGYWLDRDSGGRGIATQSTAALLSFCFDTLQLNRVEIRCAVENVKSQAVPQRLGFELEGIFKQAEAIRGAFYDLKIYAILKEQWENQRGNAPE